MLINQYDRKVLILKENVPYTEFEYAGGSQRVVPWPTATALPSTLLKRQNVRPYLKPKSGLGVGTTDLWTKKPLKVDFDVS